MILYSLQGLGNSIINYPVLAALRARGSVRVVAFDNGSAAFFQSCHPDVTRVRTNVELIRTAWAMRDAEVVTCGPTWRREIAAHRLTRATRKRVLRPRGFGRFWTPRAPAPRPCTHDLENNLDLVGWSLPTPPPLAPEVKPQSGPRRLGLHPTASTPLKYYPAAFWQKLITRLRTDFDEVDIFCGSDLGEIEFARAVGEGRCAVHAGLRFADLIPRLAGLAHFVGTDSALMHLAAQLGRPTVGLWSYADFRRIHPYGDAAAIYVPRETVAATQFERPLARPAYLDRAEANDVVTIVRGTRPPNETLPRRFGPAVALHEY